MNSWRLKNHQVTHKVPINKETNKREETNQTVLVLADPALTAKPDDFAEAEAEAAAPPLELPVFNFKVCKAELSVKEPVALESLESDANKRWSEAELAAEFAISFLPALDKEVTNCKSLRELVAAPAWEVMEAALSTRRAVTEEPGIMNECISERKEWKRWRMIILKKEKKKHQTVQVYIN